MTLNRMTYNVTLATFGNVFTFHDPKLVVKFIQANSRGGAVFRVECVVA